MTLIDWFTGNGDPDGKLVALEREWEKKVHKIGAVFDDNDSNIIPVQFGFPERFLQLSYEYCIGSVEWRDFFCDPEKGILSCHNRWSKGAMIRSHRHPQADEYIYVVNGELINHSHGQDRIIPAERFHNDKALMEDPYVNAWYKIPHNTKHLLEATEDNTHFISKYILHDD